MKSKKPYVYVLIDPDHENEVFYVGKGKNKRLVQHFHDAEVLSNEALAHEEDQKSFLSDFANDDIKLARGKLKRSNTEKLRRLNELLNRYDKRELTRVIAVVDSESEAFLVESLLIKFVYGMKNLTNEVSGHHSYRFRCKGDWEIRNWLDFPLIMSDGRRDRTQDLQPIMEEAEANFGGVSVIDEVARRVVGDGSWTQWKYKNSGDATRYFEFPQDNPQFRAKVFFKTVPGIAVELRGISNNDAVRGMASRLGVKYGRGYPIRGDGTFYPKSFRLSKAALTLDPEEVERRVRTMIRIALSESQDDLDESDIDLLLK